MKILTATMLLLFLFSARADESGQWQLNVVTGEHLYPIRLHFDLKDTCTKVGVAWAQVDSRLEGFICAPEWEWEEWVEPEGEGS